jgi:peroxiredoxin
MSELHGLQTRIEDIRALDAEVLAISADPVEQGRGVVEQLQLDYAVLSDPGLVAIDAYGLRHVGGGLDGDIARPAVYVLDRDGRVVWRDLTENWRVRVRPQQLIDVLAGVP